MSFDGHSCQSTPSTVPPLQSPCVGEPLLAGSYVPHALQFMGFPVIGEMGSPTAGMIPSSMFDINLRCCMFLIGGLTVSPFPPYP